MSTGTMSAGPVGASGGRTPGLDRLLAELRSGDPGVAEATAAAIDAWRRPVRIQVTGRARAGKSTLLHALALIAAEETAPVDEPGRADPVLDGDLVVYVLAAVLQPADRRVLTALPADRTLVVLNKADAIGSRWSDAVAAAERYARELGLPVLPVVATLAAHARAHTPAEDDLRTLRRHVHRTDPAFTLSPELFAAAAAGPDVADRQALLDRWGLYGVACALTALRHDPELGPRPLLQLLHAAGGIEPVHALVHARYEQIVARRGGELLDELTRLAARVIPDTGARAREVIEDYLTGDEALWLGVRSGLACPRLRHLADGRPVRPADADDALARAERWRAVVSSDMPAVARRAALRVHNGYVRLWERMSSAGL
ncbi:hypothetical protein NDR87_29070 [Nocardia sp. CDC159]|uniref:50S ribosome-binding GTPase n=1 Tax=Nocardia pulmonis TaxID=2951408 RepID=A0A9X2J0W6_9NOCA|nr:MULTISPECIES: hypothetical protein [Nocardia]MCM6777460.1 hypothetical protein [Nocardia pulmonis]MCM6790433.1 hypothetical protein [Nocardia sp. CDC159]